MLDFSKPGKVCVDMEAYINMVLSELPDEMRGKAVTPAASHLFKTNVDNPSLLDDDKATLFHHVTMQLLYLSQRARPDIRTAVSYLNGRVLEPSDDGYNI